MKTDKVHFGYITFILIAIIICLMTVKWGGIQELTNYIVFALTLTSLVLGALAIVYSFFSNSSMEKNLYNLEDVSKKIAHNSELLNSATKTLEQHLCDIPPSLKNIETKQDDLRQQVENLTKKELEPESAHTAGKIDEDTSIGKILLHKGSISSTEALLALTLAFKTGINLDLQDIDSKIEGMSTDYWHGFLISCSLLKLYEYNSVKDEKTNRWAWKITQVSSDILDNVDDAVSDLIKEHSNESSMSFIEDGFTNIREYFENASK